MTKVENYRLEKKAVNGTAIFITSYKIGTKFYCHIENIDPGATIARAYGETQEAAKQAAIAKALERI